MEKKKRIWEEATSERPKTQKYGQNTNKRKKK